MTAACRGSSSSTAVRESGMDASPTPEPRVWLMASTLTLLNATSLLNTLLPSASTEVLLLAITSTRSLGRTKPLTEESSVTGMATARMPSRRMELRKPASPGRTILASTIGSPTRKADRARAPCMVSTPSGISSRVIISGATLSAGQGRHCTPRFPNCSPVATLRAATSTSTVAGFCTTGGADGAGRWRINPVAR